MLALDRVEIAYRHFDLCSPTMLTKMSTNPLKSKSCRKLRRSGRTEAEGSSLEWPLNQQGRRIESALESKRRPEIFFASEEMSACT